MARLVLPLAIAALCGVTSAAGLMESGVARLTRGAGVAQSGSRPCGRCHSSEFALWSQHPHSHALIDPQTDPRRITARWGRRVPGWREYVEGRFQREQVVRAFGVGLYQVYFRADPDGHRLLPACWHLTERRWLPLPAELARVEQEGATWGERCAGCHTTGYRPVERTSDEFNVGCMACHGDGAEHLASEGRTPMLRPDLLEPKRSAEVCGACHSRGIDPVTGAPYAARFRPGAVLGDTFRVMAAPPEGDARFWPGGVERLPYMEYQGFLQSAHFRGGLRCTSCHLPHGSQYGKALVRRTEDLCTECHAGGGARGPVHTRHPAGKAGCVDCHMAVVNPGSDWVPVRTHTLRFLEPERAQATGMPSSCATASCHAGRDAAWAAGVVRAWRQRP
ncbi:MAG TPA: cytochrome c3 family protein [Deferrisomatales bacterium]|nr:cytochrome c3 family protein [Deferrisomatales bacterium]